MQLMHAPARSDACHEAEPSQPNSAALLQADRAALTLFQNWRMFPVAT
jgi:hypothetical protein